MNDIIALTADLHDFFVNIDATKAYYQRNTLCECDCCQIFYDKAKARYPELADYLMTFGVNISRPDEAMSVETDDVIKYISVDYTVCGRMTPDAEYKTLISNEGLTIKVNNGFVSPNEQAGEYFTISVEGINLPLQRTPKAGFSSRLMQFIKIGRTNGNSKENYSKKE